MSVPRAAPDPNDASIATICRACGKEGARWFVWLRRLEYWNRARPGSYCAYVWGEEGFYAGSWNREGFRLSVIAVIPSERGKGLGQRMLAHLFLLMQKDGRRRLTFRCAAGSPAEAWWIKRGARVVARKGEELEMELRA